MAGKNPLHTPGSAMAVAICAIVLGIVYPLMPPEFFPFAIILAYLCDACIVAVCWKEAKKIWRGLNKRSLNYKDIPNEFWFVFAVSVVCFIITTYALIYHIYGSHSSSTSTSEKRGAFIEITALGREALQDGTYYLPISVENTGDMDVTGYRLWFAQNAFSASLSPTEEDQFMLDIENEIKSVSVEEIVDTGSLLVPHKSLRLRELKLKFTESDMKEIISGKKIPYSGVVVAYIDDVGKEKHVLYYAERCVYYDWNIGKFLNCAKHNFGKLNRIPN